MKKRLWSVEPIVPFLPLASGDIDRVVNSIPNVVYGIEDLILLTALQPSSIVGPNCSSPKPCKIPEKVESVLRLLRRGHASNSVEEIDSVAKGNDCRLKKPPRLEPRSQVLQAQRSYSLRVKTLPPGKESWCHPSKHRSSLEE